MASSAERAAERIRRLASNDPLNWNRNIVAIIAEEHAELVRAAENVIRRETLPSKPEIRELIAALAHAEGK